MDAQQFLAEFGHIANAPGGVGRLRQMILVLAAAGDLITTSAQTSGIPLLLSIERQKREHKEQKKVVPKQAIISATQSKAPAHWALCRLGDLTLTITGGGTPSKNNPRYWAGDIPWASVKDLKDQKYLSVTADHISIEGLAESSSNLIPANRVIVCTRMGLGKIVINTVALAINQDLKAFELPAEVNQDFFFILYKTRELKGTGTTVAGIRQDQLLALPAALPPIEEQSRIVAKVDELMALCDTLEIQQQQRRSLQNNLRQSTLQAVAAATSPHELQATWARLADNFDQLFDAPENVAGMRDVIFDLAMRGVLLSNATMQAEASIDDMPPLPTGWEWKTLGDVTEYITSGSRGWKSYMSATGDAFIRSQDIKQDALVFENPAFVTLPEKAEGKRTLVRQGDLLLTITGGNVGKCAPVPALDCKAYVSQHVALIRLLDSSMAEFIHFWMINANGGRGFLSRYIYGDKPGLNLAQVASIPIPIPPAVERQQILRSLQKYQVICAHWTRQLGDERKLAALLSASAVASITGIAIAPEKEELVKAPQTEIIAPLRLGILPVVTDQSPLATLLSRQKGSMNAGDLFQRYGGEVDAFYAQLKLEISHGWIDAPPSDPDAEGFASVRVKEQA